MEDELIKLFYDDAENRKDGIPRKEAYVKHQDKRIPLH
jgi:hypothetical protein